jgi:hypothetical protein
MKAQFDDVRHMLELETDYEQEAENLRIARSAFTEDEGIVVPRVFPEFSTRRVLTMEYIEGLHLDKFLGTDPPQELRNQFGHKITVSVFRLERSRDLIYADPQPGNYLFMPDGRLGFIDFGSCKHRSKEERGYQEDVERATFESPEILRDALAHGMDLTPTQAADENRMKYITEWTEWAWEPVLHEGPFDFTDGEHFRRGAELYAEAIKRRYTRSRPVHTWTVKAIYGLRAMLTRLKACVDYGAVFRAETAARQDSSK